MEASSFAVGNLQPSSRSRLSRRFRCSAFSGTSPSPRAARRSGIEKRAPSGTLNANHAAMRRSPPYFRRVPGQNLTSHHGTPDSGSRSELVMIFVYHGRVQNNELSRHDAHPPDPAMAICQRIAQSHWLKFHISHKGRSHSLEWMPEKKVNHVTSGSLSSNMECTSRSSLSSISREDSKDERPV